MVHLPELDSGSLSSASGAAVTRKMADQRLGSVSVAEQTCTTPKDTNRKPLRMITTEQLAQHVTRDSLWITVNNKVYDVTKWAKHHPGGEAALMNVGGRDATDLMNQFHRPEVWKKRINNWYIGELVQASPLTEGPSIAEDFRKLGRWIEDNGWYRADKSYYIMKMSALVCMLSVAVYMFGLNLGSDVSPGLSFYFSAFLIGLFWQQANFVGHDVGHSSVFDDNSNHKYLGVIVGNAFTGLSISWWKHSHETHHVATNVISHDPDIQHLPVFAITSKMFKYITGKGAGIFSSYWNTYMPFDRVSQFFVSYQHWLFYPIMSVARINLLAQSLLFTLQHPKCQGFRKVLELSTLAVHYCWWGYMLYLCPSWSSRLLYWYIANATVGVIHVQICLSHFMMETFEEMPYRKNEESYYEYQLRTTLDVDCPRYMDWFHGGLQYQTIHHLYPRLPRHRLRALRKKVEEIVAKYKNVQYHHYSFVNANMLTLRHMYNVALEARAGKFIPFKNTMIFEGLHAIG
ncbi:uncharacterized protein [Watersipora subatra]|uniref:uncharacterized protein n=1 Tax=Watersipora subatra TaxID=2589382 RepID=UPI00355B6812